MWIGIYPRTGEHLVAKLDGEVIRVRTVRRVPAAHRWDAAAVRGIRALPRRPHPDKESEKQEVEPELATGTEPAPREDGGADLGKPEVDPRKAAPRELRITDRLLEKYGFAVGCQGCVHKQLGLDGHRGHSAECRARIYDLMSKDREELDNILETERRLGRQPAEGEKIRRPAAPDAVAPEPVPEPVPPVHGG